MRLSGDTSEDAVALTSVDGLREETGVGAGTRFAIEGGGLAVYFAREGFQLY
jgi:hypothetical protein